MADVYSSSAAPHRLRILAAPLIDVVAAAIIVAVVAWVAPTQQWWWAIASAVVLVTIWLLGRGISGMTVGYGLLGLRRVDRVTGLPSYQLTPGNAVTRGSGADPFALRPRATKQYEQATRPTRAVHIAKAGLLLIVDDGTTHSVTETAVIGRNPTPSDPRVLAIAIPDLSRTVSKAHLSVAAGERGVTVTDLASANGTWVVGAPTPLVPHTATLVPWGSKLDLGERRITLERRGREGA